MPTMKKESSVTQARKGSKSFRTTIPKEIADLLDLEPKDKIVWKVEIKGEDINTIVRKKEK